MIRPNVLMPDWQYCHFAPGSNCNGLSAKCGISSASVRAACDCAPVGSGMPELWVSRCRRVTICSLPSAVLRWASSGMYLPTGSSTESFPSSCNIMIAVAVIGLVIEAIQNIASVFIGSFLPTSAMPCASSASTLPRLATNVTAPAMSCFSMNGAREFGMAASFAVSASEAGGAAAKALTPVARSNVRKIAQREGICMRAVYRQRAWLFNKSQNASNHKSQLAQEHELGIGGFSLCLRDFVVNRAFSGLTLVGSHDPASAQDVAAHRFKQRAPARPRFQRQLGVQCKQLEKIAVRRIALWRGHSGPAGLQIRVLALHRACRAIPGRASRSALGNARDRWRDVIEQPMHKRLRCRRIGVLDDQDDRPRPRGQPRPFQRR